MVVPLSKVRQHVSALILSHLQVVHCSFYKLYSVRGVVGFIQWVMGSEYMRDCVGKVYI
jgi:hypothetical protein